VIELLDRPSATATPARSFPSADERAARRTLLVQIERLEAELAGLLASAWPRQGIDWGVDRSRRRPHVLDLGELERVRDALATRISTAERELRARKRVEDANRDLIEDMLREPSAHRWVRVSHADIGEPGCRHWHVVPRLGIVGMLANWWHVKVSSGCPLAEPALAPAPDRPAASSAPRVQSTPRGLLPCWDSQVRRSSHGQAQP
jgi:hypothetical protein